MVFSGLIFLFMFLPAVILLYYICPARFRNAVLLLASLVFYAWGEPKYILIMIFSAVFNYVMGLLTGKYRDGGKTVPARVCLIASVAGNLALLVVFKYVGNYIGLRLPIGISFYTFQAMSYVIDVYRGGVPAQRSFLNFATYITMFPQLIAGPIVRYADVEKQLVKRDVSVDKFACGVRRFIVGLAKKVLLANMVGKLWEYSLATPADERTVVLSWLGALAFTFQIYFDFSGYSDMAIGLGKMFGFDYNENFNYPYVSKSITEFWRRWHISLGSWFREYVYIPLGGNRKGILRQVINILIVWALTGIWHGATPNFLLWGLYFGVLLILEKVFLGKILERIPRVFSHIYAMLLVVMGWVLFAIDDRKLLGGYVADMFASPAGFCDGGTIYMLCGYGILLVICILGSLRLPAVIAGKLQKKMHTVPRIILNVLFYGIVFMACVSLIVGDSYNPFLYFRF